MTSDANIPEKSGQTFKGTVGVVGLGLIGGSIAKAYQAAGWTVLGFDTDRAILQYAMISGVVNGVLDDAMLGLCDIVHLAVCPAAAVDYLTAKADLFNKAGIVIDDCGIKRVVCEAGFRLARAHGFTFVGGHPMAGTHMSGFKYSKATMFVGAPMIIVPDRHDDIELLDRVKFLLAPLGFKRHVVTDAVQHDRMIAFTSQLAHVVSNAYIKSPSALNQKGYSAGSFRDLTRVAWLNENMWTELFLENKEFLLEELDTIIGHLTEYRDAMRAGDAERLRTLLRDGRLAKEMSEKQ